MMASFTSNNLLKLYKKEVKQYLIITSKYMLEQVPNGVGVVVNPGVYRWLLIFHQMG
jgi:hypothetical protein